MNIIIPMAGLGERFFKAGFSVPKPLILLNNIPMYRHAVNCLPLSLGTNIIFILRKSEFSSQLENDIHENFSFLPKYSVLTLPKETRGQAETIMLAADYLNLTQPSLIHNCDTSVIHDLDWLNILKSDADGAISLFSSQENRWSYANIDPISNLIIQFKEKQVISNHASTGLYYFKNTKYLLQKIQYLIENNFRENNEFYLSTVYQLMINEKKRIKPLWAKKMLCFGTPEDLVNSLNKLLLENM